MKSNRVILTISSIVVAMIIVTMVALVCVRPASASNPKEIRPVHGVTVLTCPYGCGIVEGDTMLGDFVSREHEWLRLHAQETPGYIYNIREVAGRKARWPKTMFGTEDSIFEVAKSDLNIVKKYFFPKPLMVDWKFLYSEAIWTQGFWMATLDPKIKSLADLKGKRIGLGIPGQSDWGMDMYLFLNIGYGITEENSRIEWLGPMKATESLLDGRAAAASMGMAMNIDGKAFPAPPVRTLEASGRKIYWLTADPEAVKKLNKVLYNNTVKFRTLPAGVLPFQDKPLQMATDIGYKGVHPSFDEKLAYEIVKMVAKLGPKMAKVHGFWKLWSPRQMLLGLTEENTNPGAIRAYKELGWWEKYR